MKNLLWIWCNKVTLFLFLAEELETLQFKIIITKLSEFPKIQHTSHNNGLHPKVYFNLFEYYGPYSFIITFISQSSCILSFYGPTIVFDTIFMAPP